jgi:hypothetical protein
VGLALLVKGVVDVASDGGVVFQEVLHRSPMERVGGLERLLKVLGLRTSSVVGRGHHLLPATLLVLHWDEARSSSLSPPLRWPVTLTLSLKLAWTASSPVAY